MYLNCILTNFGVINDVLRKKIIFLAFCSHTVPKTYRTVTPKTEVRTEPWFLCTVTPLIMKPCWKEQKSEHAVKVLMKLRRSQPNRAPEMRQDICFFCRQPAGNEGLREAATFQLDKRVRAAASLLQDTELLGRLSAGDMVAIEAKYPPTCCIRQVMPYIQPLSKWLWLLAWSRCRQTVPNLLWMFQPLTATPFTAHQLQASSPPPPF